MNPALLEIFMGGGPRVMLESRDVIYDLTTNAVSYNYITGINFSNINQRYFTETGGQANYHVWYPFGTVPANTYWLKWTWTNLSGTFDIGPLPTPLTGGTPDPYPWSQFYFRKTQDSGYNTPTSGLLTLTLCTDSAGTQEISQSLHNCSITVDRAGTFLTQLFRSNVQGPGDPGYGGLEFTDLGVGSSVHRVLGADGNGLLGGFYWCYDEPVPANTYWIRGTISNQSGVEGQSADGVWVAMPTASTKWWIRRDTQGTATATLTMELATDSSGTNIISTTVQAMQVSKTAT